MGVLCLRLLLAVAFPARAEAHDTLNTIRVQRDEGGNLKYHEILKTEVIQKEAIDKKRAQTFAEAVANQVGIDAQNSCASCGAKRITINGLRGEHTTVLIDGVPMHSAVSSFYGMDAIPVVGIDSIEISRGSGASLIAPEAIGGVINIITARPKQTGVVLNGSLGTSMADFISLLGGAVAGQGRHRLTVAGQLSYQGFWDVDSNKVSEAPGFGNHSFFLKGSTEITPTARLEMRLARQVVDILGGTVNDTRPSAYVPYTGWQSFQDNDVSKLYLDTQAKITDVVDLARWEGMVRGTHFFSDDAQLQLTSSVAEQEQNSIYMHGYDYNNKDLLLFEDARVLFSLGERHFLTLGADMRNQDMSSSSAKLYGVLGLPKDNFSYRSRAAYLQDVWVLSDTVELSAALRVDDLRVTWPTRSYSIHQTLAAPRAHLKVSHGKDWTSRLMYGRGYRAPLSFFESQHGLDENGFVIEITDLEKSHSLGYSLALVKPMPEPNQIGFSMTLSSHMTWIQNIAFADGNVPTGDAAIFRNYPGWNHVWANDVVVSWDAHPHWSVLLSYENYALPDSYKALLPVAAIQQRIRLVTDFHLGNWELVNTLNWIGARDLTPFGYGRHYRTYAFGLIDPSNPGLGNTDQVVAPKNLKAPDFLTWDIYVGWKWKERCTFFASVQNVFNFTQTAAGDSPLNWSTHGTDPTDFHLDSNHVWGPLRGRVFSVGLKAEI